MSKYKSFGITLLLFWILIVILSMYVFYIYYNNLVSNINLNLIPYLFWNNHMFYTFVIFTFLILLFSLIHGIYLFSVKKENSYTKKDEKDVLTTTFVGYFFIILAYLILFVPIIIQLNLSSKSNITLIASILFGLFTIIGMILISVGLSKSNEKDQKLKNLKYTSVVSPILISITSLIYGIAPASTILVDIQNIFSAEETKSINIGSPELGHIRTTSMVNGLTKLLNQNQTQKQSIMNTVSNYLSSTNPTKSSRMPSGMTNELNKLLQK